MPTTFASKANNAQSYLTTTHVSGDGKLIINAGDQSKFNFTSLPTRVTAYPVSGQANVGQRYGTVFNVNSTSSNQLNVTVASDEVPAQSDQNMTVGTVVWYVEQDLTMGAMLDHEKAINALEEQVSTLYSDSGSANAYVITPSPAITSYAAGQRFTFIPANANTAASTINVNGLGAKTVQYGGQALTAGFIAANVIATVVYDGTSFQLQNPATNLLGSASLTSSFTNTTTPTIVDVGLSTAVTVPAGRSVLILVQPTYVKNSAASNTIIVYIREGSTTLTQAIIDVSSGISGNAIPLSLSYAASPSAGSHTYKVSMSQSGAGTMTFGSAGSTGPDQIVVYML